MAYTVLAHQRSSQKQTDRLICSTAVAVAAGQTAISLSALRKKLPKNKFTSKRIAGALVRSGKFEQTEKGWQMRPEDDEYTEQTDLNVGEHQGGESKQLSDAAAAEGTDTPTPDN